MQNDTILLNCRYLYVLDKLKFVYLFQLLTHTFGIPDYFDEDVMDDFSESEYYPDEKVEITILGNREFNAYKFIKKIENIN